MTQLYPWLEEQWSRLVAITTGDRPHHALILAGPSGIGKRELATLLAQQLVCEEQGEFPCGQCRNCHIFLAGSHPDIHVILTEKEKETGRLELLSAYSERYAEKSSREPRANPSKIIPIDKIRSLMERFYQSSYSAARKIALLLPADRLNVNAANALLKLLEEPPPGNHFLLITDQPGTLLPTIRSRCIVEMITGPTDTASRDWLRTQMSVDDSMTGRSMLAGMGPLDILADQKNGILAWQADQLEALRALCAGKSDPITLAESFAKQDPMQLLGWLQRVMAQWIRCQVAEAGSPWGTRHQGPLPHIPDRKLFILYDHIGHYRHLAQTQLNLRYALEEVLILLDNAVHRSR